MLESPECFCVDRLCSAEPNQPTPTYKTSAVIQLILMAQTSYEPVGTRIKELSATFSANNAENGCGSQGWWMNVY